MQFFRDFFLVTALTMTMLAPQASAQATKPQPPSPPAAAATSNPSMPQVTTASFADWTLRCTRTSATVQICEVVQAITNQERAVAQLAFGRLGKGQPLHFTILVPSSVTLSAAPALVTMRDSDPATVEMVWRRCLPGGCVADGIVTDEAMRRVRGWSDAGRVTYADGAGRAVALPFSAKGLAQAMDALGKEDAS